MTETASAASARRAPAYYHGWNIVGACVLSQMSALGLTLNCLSLFMPGWSKEFGTPISVLALGITFFSLGCALWAVPAGLASDRVPVRRVMGFGLLMIALAELLISFSQAGWQIVAVYAVLLPLAVTFASAVPAQTLVTRWFSRRRGLAMGLNAFGLALAGILFPKLITTILPDLGWRGVWQAAAALVVFVALPIVFFTLRDRPAERDGLHYIAPDENVMPQALPFTQIARDVFGRHNFWVIIGAFLPVQCLSMVNSVLLATIALHRGLTLTQSGSLLAIGASAALVSKLSTGMIADRIGNRLPLAAVALLAGLGAIVLGSAHSFPAFVGGVILVGLSQGHWTMLASATAAEFGPAKFGRAYGIISTFTTIGALAPPIIARIEEGTGSFATGLYGFAALAIAGGLLALTLKQPRIAR